MRIKKMIFHQFMGFDDYEVNMDGKNTIIEGGNAKGKTTIATGHYWLFADKNYSLASNPQIRPNNMEESIPSVEEIIDIDGHDISFKKIQKCKKSKPDENGVQKISLTNTYEINCVPVTERDFKAKSEEYGIRADLFLPCSHIEVFTSQKAADMRKVLFGMADTTLSDSQIAKKLKLSIAEDLGTYSVDEISAMNKASYKKACEMTTSIPAMITGMESAKVIVDKKFFEEKKMSMLSKISALEEKRNTMLMSMSTQELEDEKFKVQFEVNERIRSFKEESGKATNKLALDINDKEFAITKAQSKLVYLGDKQRNLEAHLVDLKKELEETGAAYKKNKNLKFVNTIENYYDPNEFNFDPKSEYCPCCGQKLPEKDIKARKAELEAKKIEARNTAQRDLELASARFNESKDKILNHYIEQGRELQNAVTETTENIKQIKADANALKKEISKSEKEVEKLRQKLEELKSNNDIHSDKEYCKLVQKKIDIEKKIQEIKENVPSTVEIDRELSSAKAELKMCEESLYQASVNENIDKKIENLRLEQLTHEQVKANCEKITDELDALSRKKNELLTDSINKHFKIAKFQLFEYLKNGSYKDCCKVIADGKELGATTNTALEVMLKLDIANGLQKFYGLDYPVFIDNAECLDTTTYESIQYPFQMIFLAVTDGNMKVRN